MAASLVFENIEMLVNIFNTAKISEVYLHNPPKRFLNIIKQQISPEDVAIEQTSFPKITEEQLRNVSKDLSDKIIGQDKAKQNLLRKLVAQIIRPSGKPLVLMFYGEPGIGKTETAKQLSTTLFCSENIVREQMSMVGGESSLKYFKSTDHSDDSFSKTLLNRESNVILLDEFVLAPKLFHSSFFQLFDEGVYEDQNYQVNLNNSIIICTSNFKSKVEMENNIDIALLSRFDGFIKFSPLSFDEKNQILENTYSNLANSKFVSDKYLKFLNKQDILDSIKPKLNFLPNVRVIRKYVEDVVSDKLLEIMLGEKHYDEK